MLTNKIVIITGGAGLLGKEFVKAIVNENGTAIIADIDDKHGENVKSDISIELNTNKIDFIKLDITSKESVTEMIEQIVEKYGKIDALINNAYPRNKNYGRKFEDVTYDDFCENLNLHLGGYFLVSQQIAIFFKQQGYGNIVNMSSIYGVIPPRFEIYENTPMTMPVEYAAIKSAVIHLTKYMAKYLKGTNIRVNCISPGGILDSQPQAFLEKYNKTALTKGMLDRSDIQGTLIYLLSDMSQYVNGQNIIVDDGWSL